jgi:CHASE2 domain-containing sensor protein
MDDKALLKTIKKLIAWLLLAVSLAFLLTGFGITNPELVGPFTVGILSKSWSIRLHEVLWAPFLALLATHVILRHIGRL